MAIAAYDNQGIASLLSSGFIERTDYAESMEVTLLLTIPKKAKYTIVILQRAISASSQSYSLTLYHTLERSQIQWKQLSSAFSHKYQIRGCWNVETAGGNASFHSYNQNPQYLLQVDQRIDLLILLETKEEFDIQAELILSSGDRIVNPDAKRILAKGKQYSKQCISFLARGVTAADYTLVCSTYKPGCCAEFRVTMMSTSPIEWKALKLIGAGQLSQRITGELSSQDKLSYNFKSDSHNTIRIHVNIRPPAPFQVEVRNSTTGDLILWTEGIGYHVLQEFQIRPRDTYSLIVNGKQRPGATCLGDVTIYSNHMISMT